MIIHKIKTPDVEIDDYDAASIAMQLDSVQHSTSTSTSCESGCCPL